MLLLVTFKKTYNHRIIRKFDNVSVSIVAVTIIGVQDVEQWREAAALRRISGRVQLIGKGSIYPYTLGPF